MGRCCQFYVVFTISCNLRPYVTWHDIMQVLHDIEMCVNCRPGVGWQDWKVRLMECCSIWFGGLEKSVRIFGYDAPPAGW